VTLTKSNAKVESPYFPCREFVVFDQAKPEAISKKLRELNDKIPADDQHKLNDTAMEAMNALACGTINEVPSAEQMEILPNIIIHWPKDSVFPAIDILRLIIRRPSVNQTLFEPSKGSRFIQLLYALVHESQPDTNKMLALRCLANAFSHPPGVFLMLAQQSEVTTHCMTLLATCKNKGAQIALATIYLNYAISVTKVEDVPVIADVEEPVGQIVTTIDLLLVTSLDSECIFRCICALGTLLDPSLPGGPVVAQYAARFIRSCDLPVMINKILTDQLGVDLPQKVKEATRSVDQLLLQV